MASVCSELITQISSAIRCVYGSRSPIGVPACAARLEPVPTRCDRQPLLGGDHAGEPLALPDRIGQVCVEHRVEPRLRIEQFQLRRARRTGTGRSPASPSASNASPAVRPVDAKADPAIPANRAQRRPSPRLVRCKKLPARLREACRDRLMMHRFSSS